MSMSEEQINETAALMKKRDGLKLATGLVTGITIVITLLALINSYKSGEVDELLIFAAALAGATLYGYVRLSKLDKEVAERMKVFDKD